MRQRINKASDPLTDAVSTMLHPSSVAIVGATTRSHFGSRLLSSLVEGGYKGRIYPVNPRYDELMGVLPCCTRGN